MGKHEKKSSNVVWHQSHVTRDMRETQAGHRAGVLWFTGLSGAGKSTLAHAVEQRLHAMGVRTYVIDGDNVRHGLCSDLGFSDADRVENIRRVAEVAGLFVQAGVLTLTAFISPFRGDRAQARELLGNDFIEVYCNTPLEICEGRDVKGLYAKARAGEIPAFTGISSPYEAPEHAEIVVPTGSEPIEASVDRVIAWLETHQWLRGEKK
ncbi:MAG: adenylyl-sulfate kinase [Zetaproteobacteria bacterium CG12_big_fil_rev_8_21_14_0_65_55_1124]|nr:MAG: adenylyl-sulfate kinase [Zetaproteobacteria bacterium CG1_02_55_237]PIS19804.1 MAG: adenylyl-sulfate kinase [Zetaproteobacteria bacterium CG08_land_8_20_14_0_20_55_17]PIW42836.1 MAG: adenylyl-sulfate kinase [Zetaproteobacteria bacterium CG12_big_fil_rev_8_21_14_0_65_55_1124]PIY51651.1 MAG: adenylyl-sulfate kinase [Zetaproteobacteria bacterium CG_4_10_14_0_8_um_filter_55_43]PIZ39824.1 MAG: adenylyl-sulfate kinase [Zetaproteobacteria bacterium CG_4_10_14_0_2_um_filter_55_20]PJB80924.1 MA